MAQTERAEKEKLYLPDNLENCHADLRAARQELEETKGKYLWAAGQVENVRKRTERDTLPRAGIQRIHVEPGQTYDPNYQAGVEVQFGAADQPTIVAVTQPGYLYENNLFRPAGVVVIRSLG
jgi:molecular chaperone GrpE (heat shock protein)